MECALRQQYLKYMQIWNEHKKDDKKLSLEQATQIWPIQQTVVYRITKGKGLVFNNPENLIACFIMKTASKGIQSGKENILSIQKTQKKENRWKKVWFQEASFSVNGSLRSPLECGLLNKIPMASKKIPWSLDQILLSNIWMILPDRPY